MAVKTINKETDKSSQNQSKPWEFKPGQSGNPAGKPKGSIGGRARALLMLDEIMAKAGNLKLLGEEFQKAFKAKPLSFFKTYVMPLLPKETKLTGDGIQINITHKQAESKKVANNRLLEQLN